MTVLSSVLGATTLLATTSKKSSSSSSEFSLILIVALFAIVYFFFLRPRQQRARQRTVRGKTFGIGDEVMSVGGIYGRVVGLQDDSVDVEVAPGIVLTFLRRAVNPRPAGSSSGTGGARGAGQVEPSAGPYGGPAPSPPVPSTEFGASSGHFDEAARAGDAGRAVGAEAEGHLAEDDGWDGEDDDWDFEDEEGEDEEGEDEEGEDEEGEEGEARAEPAGSEAGTRAGEEDRDASGGSSSSAPDGSATGTPRTTGGSSSDED
jgi:preprotein translocase subunit YajC